MHHIAVWNVQQSEVDRTLHSFVYSDRELTFPSAPLGYTMILIHVMRRREYWTPWQSSRRQCTGSCVHLSVHTSRKCQATLLYSGLSSSVLKTVGRHMYIWVKAQLWVGSESWTMPTGAAAPKSMSFNVSSLDGLSVSVWLLTSSIWLLLPLPSAPTAPRYLAFWYLLHTR